MSSIKPLRDFGQSRMSLMRSEIQRVSIFSRPFHLNLRSGQRKLLKLSALIWSHLQPIVAENKAMRVFQCVIYCWADVLKIFVRMIKSCTCGTCSIWYWEVLLLKEWSFSQLCSISWYPRLPAVFAECWCNCCNIIQTAYTDLLQDNTYSALSQKLWVNISQPNKKQNHHQMNQIIYSVSHHNFNILFLGFLLKRPYVLWQILQERLVILPHSVSRICDY